MKALTPIQSVSALRFASSVVLILVLTSTFLDTIDSFNQRVAKIAHNAVINELNIALSFRFYQAVIDRKTQELNNLHLANPFKALSRPNYRQPQNYITEISSHSELDQAGWYFDINSKAIYFWDDVKRTPSYQLQFMYSDSNQTGQFESGVDQIERLEMVALRDN